MTQTLAPASTLISEETATAGARDPNRFGVHLREASPTQPAGVDVVLHAPHAQAAWLCLLERAPLDHGDDEGGTLLERRIALLPLAHGRWHAFVPGIGAGQRYGFRLDGPWQPQHRMAFNPAKLLLDPYARGLAGQVDLAPEIYAHPVDSDLAPIDDAEPDPRDSAPFVPHAVVLPETTGGGVWNRPGTPWSRTVVYEAHVRGLTMRLPGVPEHLRGTYAGLAHPATIAHLRALGVTAIELLPIHAKMTEPAITQRGLVNYWGYNTLAYFAPEPAYATAAAREAGAQAVLEEVKGMVQLLHDAGLEVLLDVVYNHTCEGGPDGPMMSWRGLDDAGYYLHSEPGPGYFDVTGCGNSLDFRNPRVIQLTLDSLRYWVGEIGVDGFRFDLATTLARQGAHVTMEHPFLVAMTTDELLRTAKLIVEPWDLGPHGWQTGNYPAPISEWNDRYRDCIRTFWLRDPATLAEGGVGHDLREIATRIAGSADMYAHTGIPGGRGPVASVNYVTSHDGFTLADLVAYDTKHNERNGEHNRDGTENNRSWNHGVEGPTDDQEILAARRRSMRNIIATQLLSAGVPMITAGDEVARTQEGNNNAYCHDEPWVWVNWELDAHQQAWLATVQHLTRLRRENAVLRPECFRDAQENRDGRPTLAWFEESGAQMPVDVWHDPHRRVLQMLRLATEPGGRDALVLINGAINDVPVTLAPPNGEWELVWDSGWEHPVHEEAGSRAGGGDGLTLAGLTVRLYLTAR